MPDDEVESEYENAESEEGEGEGEGEGGGECCSKGSRRGVVANLSSTLTRVGNEEIGVEDEEIAYDSDFEEPGLDWPDTAGLADERVPTADEDYTDDGDVTTDGDAETDGGADLASATSRKSRCCNMSPLATCQARRVAGPGPGLPAAKPTATAHRAERRRAGTLTHVPMVRKARHEQRVSQRNALSGSPSG
jgi:hypothetical protein